MAHKHPQEHLNDWLARVREQFQSQRRLQQHFALLHHGLPLVYMAATGLSRQQMAEARNLSRRTIEAHFDKLIQELDCEGTPHLIGKCFELGYLYVEDGVIKLNEHIYNQL